jgi:alpha-L-rhamnosidase
MLVDTRRTLKVLLPSLLLAVQSVGVASSVTPRPAPQASERASVQANPELLTRRWDAKWISAAGTDPFAFGVYHFRKSIDLAERPARFVVHVTADNRYQLFVNGVRVVWGPARGDLNHWRYETVDLAPHLRAGSNVLAAVVWNFAELAPEAQITWRTGFLIQGDTKAEQAANSNGSWKAVEDQAYSPIHFTNAEMRGYTVVGPGERVEASKYPWGWEAPGFDDASWKAAVPAVADGRDGGSPRDSQDGPNRWMLVPRTIPLMEERPERLASVRQAVGVEVPAAFPEAPAAFSVPARTHARLLLDVSHLTTAYPVLEYSGGAGSTLRLGYAESLYYPRSGERRGEKGNRNEIEGKEFVGNYDAVTADGGRHRRYSTLWWRTYRYLDLQIDTANEPLVIEDLHGIYTGYPFERRQQIDAGAPLVSQILDVGWRTARLCAHESYMDCPYYEQLQYAGDTRIQALVSLYASGDARLMKNAISLLNDSRTAEGATMSRAPTRQQQYIPPFSLWWIGMVHDYFMYVDDRAFVRDMLPGTRAILQFFARYQKASGSLAPMPWWNYVDWTAEWRGGVPPREADGSSAPLDLQLLLAYDWAMHLEQALGSKAAAAEYRAAAAQLRQTVRSLYWDAGKRLFADTPAHKQFSQHANVLAVLAGVSNGAEARDLVTRVIADTSLTQCSYYFRHYLNSAVNLVGEGDRYLGLLGEWEAMLGRGLTTFAERYDAPGSPSRSDCHAWSASPNFEIFRTVLGIDTAAPGFQRVRIRPFPGKLDRVSGSIPHPKGDVSVKLERAGTGLGVEVTLPTGVSGDFSWRGAQRPLAPGRNSFTVQPATR